MTGIQWRTNNIQIILPGFTAGLSITGINTGNTSEKAAIGNGFAIEPGVYIITEANSGMIKQSSTAEFYAPTTTTSQPLIVHQPLTEVSSSQSFSITAKIIGVDSTYKISIELRNSSNKWQTVAMQRINGYDYKGDIPADIITPWVINYRIIIQDKSRELYTFPGGFKGDPFAWDEYRNETWGKHL